MKFMTVFYGAIILLLCIWNIALSRYVGDTAERLQFVDGAVQNSYKMHWQHKRAIIFVAQEVDRQESILKRFDQILYSVVKQQGLIIPAPSSKSEDEPSDEQSPE